MTIEIPGGGFWMARTIFQSAIWGKPPLYPKLFIWIIGRANYSDYERNGHKYRRGELVTSYDEIMKSNSHHHNRRHVFPSVKQIRIILKWLKNEGMISIEPLKSKPFPTGADTGVRTWAYTGLKITVINYGTYQDSENYKDRHRGRDLPQQGHDIEKRQKNNNLPDFFSLLQRYPDHDLITRCFKAIASTRKTGQVADSVFLKQLQEWERYPVKQVEAGIRIYLEKDFAGQGKREKYLLGIIRNLKQAPKPSSEACKQKSLDNLFQASWY